MDVYLTLTHRTDSTHLLKKERDNITLNLILNVLNLVVTNDLVKTSTIRFSIKIYYRSISLAITLS